MREKIGVFMGEVTQEQQEIILKAVFAKATGFHYDVFVFCNFGAYGDSVLHTEGEKSVLLIPDLSSFSGVIVVEDTFDIEGMATELRAHLKKKATCPVVYVRATNEDAYSVLVSDGDAIANMTKHFIYEHGFRDICYMSGPYDSEDAMNRYRNFMQVMQDADIEVTEHMVFEGDYWRTKGRQAIDWFMEGRTTYPRVIICANDYMALSVCDELKRRGVRIPEDVCVSGYDDILEVRSYRPSITSISVPFGQLGEKAVEIIHRVNNGLPQEKIEYLQPAIMYRKSCGCGEQWEDEAISRLLKKDYLQDDDMKQAVFMNSEFQDAFEEEDYLRVAEKYLLNVRCEKAYLCICDRTGDEEEAGESEYTEWMILKRVFQKEEKTLKPEVHFKRSGLLPEEILEKEEAKGYLLFPIHHGNKKFGYMVFGFAEYWPYSYIQAYLMGLATAIEGANIQKELSSLEQIKNLYHRDALTGIYNRRGFERQLRIMGERYAEENKYLSIVSLDMDGLKFINDTFGHAEGDEAIKAIAVVMQKVATDEEVCARIGGDEFVMLLISDSLERHTMFPYLFNRALEEERERMDKPYRLAASYGICCINEEVDLPLIACIQMADKRMYQQKRKKKEDMSRIAK